METIFSKLILLISICFLFSCGNNESPYFKDTLKLEEGKLRGAEIGVSTKDIKTLEDSAFLVYELDDYLQYDYEISLGNTYTVSYDFSEKNELFEIELSIFLENSKEIDLLYENFENQFNRKYGVGQKKSVGFMIWNTTSSISNSNVSITLINDSDSFGFITIFIRDLSY